MRQLPLLLLQLVLMTLIWCGTAGLEVIQEQGPNSNLVHAFHQLCEFKWQAGRLAASRRYKPAGTCIAAAQQ
jgi:hypothetical protein